MNFDVHDFVVKSRTAQGLPEFITDEAVLDQVAAMLPKKAARPVATGRIKTAATVTRRTSEVRHG